MGLACKMLEPILIKIKIVKKFVSREFHAVYRVGSTADISTVNIVPSFNTGGVDSILNVESLDILVNPVSLIHYFICLSSLLGGGVQ